MSIACMLGGTGERRTKTHACHDQSPTSIPMDGNATAEAFITRQWLPDFPKTLAHCGTGRTWAGKPLFNETIRYRRGAVGCSWLFHRHRVHSATMARLSWPARLPPKLVKIINSPRTGANSRLSLIHLVLTQTVTPHRLPT